MRPMTANPVVVYVEATAQATIAQLTAAQRAQFMRLTAALRLAPEAGVFYARDTANRVLRQMSAVDVHVIYTVVYLTTSDRVFIVAIEIAEWTPQHSDMP